MRVKIIKKGWLRQKYHFVILAANHKIIAVSENYYNLGDCVKTAKLFNLPITYPVYAP